MPRWGEGAELMRRVNAGRRAGGQAGGQEQHREQLQGEAPRQEVVVGTGKEG